MAQLTFVTIVNITVGVIQLNHKDIVNNGIDADLSKGNFDVILMILNFVFVNFDINAMIIKLLSPNFDILFIKKLHYFSRLPASVGFKPLNLDH
jgi:hypothetical protein